MARRALTGLCGGGHDYRDVEELAESRVREHVVSIQCRVEVSGEVVEPCLQVEDKEDLEYLVTGLP